jgi:hypothetical protein
MLIFAEEEFFDTAKNFFDTDGRGEKAVAAQDPARDHLTLWFDAVERKHRRLAQGRIRLNLPLDTLSIRPGGIEQNEIGLEPAGGMQSEAMIMFFADEIFAGPVQSAPNESSDARLAIDY